MLLAVHISDGVLAWPWVAGGWAVAAGLVAVAARRVTDDEVPRIGVLTAALFVASQAQFRVGPTSVHLLLNGVAGVVLGRRVGLAVAVGLLLQAVLAAHGGLTTLGVNISLYGLPALAAGAAFPAARRAAGVRGATFRVAAVGATAGGWGMAAVSAGQWAWGNLVSGREFPAAPGEWWVADPGVVAGVIGLAVAGGWLSRRGDRAPDFPLGLMLGAATAAATVGLNAAVLLAGGRPGVDRVVPVVVAAHLPVVAVEAVASGLVVAYLARAKPDWLAGHRRITESDTTPSI